MGGNKEERVGESKDDGNAEDGGKPSERGFGLDRVAKCQKKFTQIISVQPNLPQGQGHELLAYSNTCHTQECLCY